MTYSDKRKKIEYLLDLISKENTGKAEDLCQRIYVSKATLKRYLQDLRELGYPISFCTLRGTYYLSDRNR